MPPVALSARGAAAPATDWLAVWLLFLGGCTLALHSGKAPSALSRLREEFALSLTATGAIVSVYALLIAALGTLVGLGAARVGHARFAVGGVALAGLASLAGSQAQGYPTLLATRALEGAGWIAATCALPTLIAAVAAARDRPLAMGLWGAFVPVGAGAMLFVAPRLEAVGGWRLSWTVAGVASLVAAATVATVCRRHRGRLDGLGPIARVDPRRELARPAVRAVAAAFLCYSFQFLAVVSFLPTLLVERTGAAPAAAARLAALVILVNAVGNVVAGALLRRGAPVGPLLGGAALASSACGAVVFLGAAPDGLRVPAALGFSILGGMLPGALFALVPRAASGPAAGGLVVGAMLQGSGIGQLAGPLALAAAVEAAGGWDAAAGLVALAGLAGAAAAAACARTLVAPDSGPDSGPDAGLSATRR